MFPTAKIDNLVKSDLMNRDGIRKKLDIRGVMSETPFQIVNVVDRAFAIPSN